VGKEQILAAATESIINLDKNKAEEIAKQGLAAGIDPYVIITEGFIPGITKMGDDFESGQVFLPELIMAADAMKAGVAICEAALPKSELREKKKVVIGTVEGDVHDIGKSIVVSFLVANGFEVYNLGRDVPIEEFIKKAKEVGAHVVGSSALLTTTMEGQKKIEEGLKAAGIRDKVKTIVGGAPCSQGWANRIGADAYAENAAEGVRKIKEMLGLTS